MTPGLSPNRTESEAERGGDVEMKTTTLGEPPIPSDPDPASKEGSTLMDTSSPTHAANVDPEKDVVPEGEYGWVIVGCIIGITGWTWGVNTTYGVFSAYYIEYNYFDATILDYAWVGGLSVSAALIVAPLANWLTKTTNFKVPMYIGACCVVLGQCLAGICTSFGPFLVCQGIVFGVGLGLPVLAHWFDRRLALAQVRPYSVAWTDAETQGMANAGSGMGGLILANTTRVALERLGVKWALIINGLSSGAVLFPAIFLLKGRHKAVGARSAPLQLKWLYHPGYMWVLLWAVFIMMSYFIALYSLASMATHGLGLSQTQGAALQSILAAGQMVGRPAWGQALDLGGRINMTIVCYIICGISSLAIWLPAKSFGVLAFFALVQGLVGGTIWSVSAPVSVRVVGVQDLASALSVYWLVLVVPALVGQPIAIALQDYSTNHLGRTGAEAYYISIGFCGGLSLLGAGLLYGAKRHLQGDWKVFKKA